VFVCYLDIPDAHSSIHAGGAELGALVSSSLQHRDLAEILLKACQSLRVAMRCEKNPAHVDDCDDKISER